jgi:hypothetical protein
MLPVVAGFLALFYDKIIKVDTKKIIAWDPYSSAPPDPTFAFFQRSVLPCT